MVREQKPRAPKPRGPLPPPRALATPSALQAYALARLHFDPSKCVIPPPPEGNGLPTLREPKEMMSNVQGSSAGAGSGEFHVYKESRRREYERLGLMHKEDILVSPPTPIEVDRTDEKSRRKKPSKLSTEQY